MFQEQGLSIENWMKIQQSLSSLCGFPIFIYDPVRKRPCSPATNENDICILVHELGEDLACFEAYEKNVTRALDEKKILFYRCQANLTYFIIPIFLDQGVQYAMIGGQAYLSEADVEAFREKAIRWGISSSRLSGLMENCSVASEALQLQKARDLQTVGTLLIENVYDQNRYQAKSSCISTLTHIANQFKNDPDLPAHYGTLLNSIGILFNLESTAVFKQSFPEKVYRKMALFGKSMSESEPASFFLDGLLAKGKGDSIPVFVDDPGELGEAGFPTSVRSCFLFMLSENDQLKTTLAIFNTDLSDEDTEMISTFCLQAGVVFDLVELKNHISEQKKNIQSLSTLTAFNFHLEEKVLYKKLLDQTTQLLNAEQGSLMMFDDEKEELSVMAMTGVSPALYSLFSKKMGEGIAGRVCQSRSALLVKDIAEDERIPYSPRSRYKTPSFLSVPLIKNEDPIGVVSIADKVDGRRFTEEDLSLLMAMGSFLTMAIERSHLHTTTEILKEISITDSLTGLLNRRYFFERLTEEIERTKRHGLPTCLIMIDIDDFKVVNDSHGHLVGDEVLKWLSQLLRNTIRNIDVASRYGGEEFTVILPNTKTVDARIIADRICTAIEEKSRFQKKVPQLNLLTVSVGLASFPDDADSIHELIKHTDEALYRAKNHGKNRVVVYKDYHAC